MSRFVRLSALTAVSALFLSGAAFAEEPATPETPAAPPATQGETPAATPATAPAPATTQPAEKDPLDEIVCRKEEATVGSRIGARKICKTRRQWRDEQRDATSRELPDGSVVPPSAGGAS